MATSKRLKVLIQDGADLHNGRVLRLAGPTLLLDAGVDFPRDTELRIHTYPTGRCSVGELIRGHVVSSAQDVMVPADAEHRYLIVLELCLAAEARHALEKATPTEPLTRRVWPRRRTTPTHDLGVVEAVMGRAASA